jgi:hypothetical protein
MIKKKLRYFEDYVIEVSKQYLWRPIPRDFKSYSRGKLDMYVIANLRGDKAKSLDAMTRHNSFKQADIILDKILNTAKVLYDLKKPKNKKEIH